MKRFLLLLFLLPVQVFSQIQDLSQLSQGDVVFAETLFDANHNLYGYFFVSEMDKLDEKTVKYEYILLDKNLNPVFNMEMIDPTHKRVKRVFSDVELMGNGQVSLTSNYEIKKGLLSVIMCSSVQMISIDKKTIDEEFYLQDKKLLPVPDDFEELFEAHRKWKNMNTSRVYGVSYDGFTGYLALNGLETVSMFDYDKNELWDYRYNDPPKVIVNERRGKLFIMELIKDNYALALEVNKDIRKKHYYKKIKGFGLTPKTKHFDYLLQDGNSEHNYLVNKAFKFNNQFHLFGEYSNNSADRTTYIKNRLGMYRCVIDSEGKEIGKNFFGWEELADDMKINKNGRLANGYQLKLKTIFAFKNGSSAILFEKFKPATQYTRPKTTDMVLVCFDKNFKYQAAHTMKKAKTKSHFQNDYLYAQYIKDRTGVVFLFKDEVKNEDSRKKEWILGINALINGEYKYEQIPMESEEYEMDVMPAKEGYILIHEYDKKDPKKKNEIRLERLNLE